MVCIKMLGVGKWAVMVVKSLPPFGLLLFGAIGEGPWVPVSHSQGKTSVCAWHLAALDINAGQLLRLNLCPCTWGSLFAVPIIKNDQNCSNHSFVWKPVRRTLHDRQHWAKQPAIIQHFGSKCGNSFPEARFVQHKEERHCFAVSWTVFWFYTVPPILLSVCVLKMFTTCWNLQLSCGIRSQVFVLMDWEEPGRGREKVTRWTPGDYSSLTLGLIRRNPVRDAFLLHEKKPPEKGNLKVDPSVKLWEENLWSADESSCGCRARVVAVGGRSPRAASHWSLQTGAVSWKRGLEYNMHKTSLWEKLVLAGDIFWVYPALWVTISVRYNTPFLGEFVSQKVHWLPSVSGEARLEERQVNSVMGSPGMAHFRARRPLGRGLGWAAWSVPGI